MISLRPYQQNTVQKVEEGFFEFDKQLIVLPTGAGKAVISAALAQAYQPGKSLILAHREELIDQAIQKIYATTGLVAQKEKAEFHASLSAPVVVASVQSMIRRLDKWPQDHFKLVIADECFPAGTQIDGKPIETLRVGDRINSFNHASGNVEVKRISKVFRNAPTALCTVSLSNGKNIVCTPGHPFWTGKQYKAAIHLTHSDLIYEKATHPIPRDLQTMRNASHLLPRQSTNVSTTACVLEQSGLLLRGMQGHSPPGKFIAHNGSHQSEVCVSQNEGEQSDAHGVFTPQNAIHSEIDQLETSNTRRQRHRSDSPATKTRNSIGLDNGISDTYELGSRIWNSNSVQGRRRKRPIENCSRSGWIQSQHACKAGAGQKKGSISPVARVDRVEVHKCSSERDVKRLCPDGFVYNIEVEENHNYFANGLLVHNCHHSVSDSWQTVLKHFDPHAKVVGCSATPDRSDKRNLGKYYQNVADEVGLFDLIDQGYLSRIVIKTMPLQIDLRGVRTVAGDYNESDLAQTIEPYFDKIITAIKEHAADRKIVVFLPLIASSQKFVAKAVDAGINAVHVDGMSPDRKEILTQFDAAPKPALISNAMLLCIDKETEILTDCGWVNCNQVSMSDKIANWCCDGTVFFKEPSEIVKRPLSDSEHMVSIESRTINLRVTNTHKMLVRSGAGSKSWKKIPAQELRSGHILPTYGIAQPSAFSIKGETPPFSTRNVVRNAYNLRKNNGFSKIDSYIEANRREKIRSDLRHKQPRELTLDECRFIGFWIADGSKNTTSGIEYTLAQSPAYPHIIQWIDALISRCGFHSVRRNLSHSKNPCIRWSLCRGTGGGSQQRQGLFSIEPYLIKTGTELFWALSEPQFDALVEGYWYGDGHHGQAVNGFPSSVVFNDTKKPWIELLCSLGPVRGWRCAMYPMPSKNPRHKDQYRLRMIKGMEANISSRTKINHEAFTPEEVWCVKTESKNIITRRRGKVTVLGNTEGWDCPSADCIIILRPTKSRPLYAQCVGRGTRTHPGKENLLLLDFLWMHERHDLVRPAHLIAKSDEEAESITKIQEEQAAAGGETQEELDLQGASTLAQQRREEALRKQLQAQSKKQSRVIDVMDFAVSIHNMDLAEYAPTNDWELEPMTAGQVSLLKSLQMDIDTIKSRGQAVATIKVLMDRRARGLATPRQLKFLKRMGYQNPENATLAEASAFLDAKWGKKKTP